MNTLHFQVEGMSCQGCAAGIEKALARNTKVKKADVDFQKKELKRMSTNKWVLNKAGKLSLINSKL